MTSKQRNAGPGESAILASMRTGAGDDAGDAAEELAAGEAVEAEIVSESSHTGQEIEVRVAEGTLMEARDAADHPAMRQLNGWLTRNLSVNDDADAAVADIIGQVLAADSVDEVLGDITLPGLQDNLDRPFILHGGKVNRSDFEAGAPFYFVLDVEWLDTHTRGMVSTGAQTVIAQVMRLIELDAFPCTMKAVKATKKPTAKGYWPYRLAGLK